MNYRWNYEPPTTENVACAEALAEEVRVSPAIAQMLVERGIRTAEQARKYFHPQLLELHDPYLMKDMDRAVERLNEAMGQRERIMIYGDYDVDGCTAVALVYRFITQFYSNVECYIPDRSEEGYGVSIQGVDYAESQGVKLVIVLDCGIKAIDEIQYAKDKGIDFIICDHHVPDEVLPPAVAILNAKRVDNTYPYLDLSGCGVGFKFMQAFSKSNGLGSMYNLEAMLDLVAVSIAADIVPLTGENRVMMFYGLRRLNNNPNVGLRSIIRTCGLNRHDLTINDIIFKIGPRINASGRMESGQESVELLVSRNMQSAMEISKRIDQYNSDRKELDSQVTVEANEIIESHAQVLDGKKPIVIYDRNWHKGVIGIVAARLAELYFRPSVVLTYYADGVATGSSRSVRGFDVYTAIKSCRDLLETFGGHTNAVGLSIKEENIPEFRRRLTAYVEDHIEDEQVTPALDIDCEIKFSDINGSLLRYLRMLNPYGPGNSKPVFVTRKLYDVGSSKVVGKKMEHIKLDLVDEEGNKVFNAIAFGQAKYNDALKAGKPIDICYTIEETRHRMSTTVQLMVKAIKLHDDADDAQADS